MSESMNPGDEVSPGQLREEAARWFARMRGEDAERHRAAFDAWLARGALHRAAYNRIGEVFAAGKGMRQTEEPAGSHRRRLVLACVFACFVAAACGVWLAGLPATRPETTMVGRASAGTGPVVLGRIVRLAGGAAVILDVDGAVTTEVSGDARLVRLDHGRARFVVPSARSPQIILAGRTEVATDGGTVDVWLRADGRVDVQAVSGVASIQPAVLFEGSGTPVRPLRLAAGQRFVTTADGRHRWPAERAGTEWPSGILEFRGAALADVLEEANRYGAITIVAEPAIAQRRVSGRFAVDDAELLARRLARALSLTVDRSNRGMIVLRVD